MRIATVASDDMAAGILARLIDAVVLGSDTHDQAARVVDALGDVEQGAAVALVLRSVDGQQDKLVNFGYAPNVLDHLTSRRFLSDDRGYRSLWGPTCRKARGWRDVTGYEMTKSARTVFIPAGFTGGATARLESGGRHIGDLHISASDPAGPTDETVRAMDLAARTLGRMLDPWANVDRAVSTFLPPGVPAALITGAGARKIEGHPPLPESVDVPALCQALHAHAPGTPFGWRDRDGSIAWLGALTLAAGVVVHVLPDSPSPLTDRETDVVTALAKGWSNRVIARELGLAERTVVHHLENIFAKVEARSRTEAAMQAVAGGWVLLGPGH
jgi:DNA-binding CsgD family transcriptional regulator